MYYIYMEIEYLATIFYFIGSCFYFIGALFYLISYGKV